jgi:aminoglycoside phosphotransferase (APT) family kinase protein
MAAKEDVDFEGLELIDVRLEIDVDRLLEYMERNSDFPAGGASVKQFNKGQSNPTYFIEDSAGDRWVLRKQPPGKLLRGAHAVDREFKVFSALADTDVPVPKMLLFCDDPAIVGTPFYVMEFINGRIEEDIAMKDYSPEERKATYESMVEVMAALHKVDYKTVGLEEFGRPSGYIQRQLRTWGSMYEGGEEFVRDPKAWEAAGLEFIDNKDYMERLLAYLNENVEAEMSKMAPEPVGIVHGDYRIGNVILHPTEPKVICVLDWELCTIGNPLADLSYQMMAW